MNILRVQACISQAAPALSSALLDLLIESFESLLRICSHRSPLHKGTKHAGEVLSLNELSLVLSLCVEDEGVSTVKDYFRDRK